MNALIAFIFWLHTLAGPTPIVAIECDTQGCQVDIQSTPTAEPYEWFIRTA